MTRARGVVAHGAAFSKHFAACTLTADDGTHDAAAVVDVVLAAKDGWGVETLAELCAALRLPRDPDDPPPSSSRTEVEIIESIPETLDDADRPGATCLHPLAIRARRCATADWRTWRAVPPTDAPPRANPIPADALPTRAPSGANPRANWRKRKNDNRASAFAALLVREFGRDRLRAGAGVVDVAGGSGELAFELAARWGIPCTIIDPRGEGVRITARHRRLLASRAANAALVPPRGSRLHHSRCNSPRSGRRSIPRERPTSNVPSTRPRWTIQNSPRSSWSVPRSSGSTRTRPRAPSSTRV